MNLTTRLGLKKPELTDTADIDDINYNSDIIDSAVGISIVTNRAAADLAGTFDGEIIYDDEVDQLFMMRSGSWHQIVMVNDTGRYILDKFEGSNASLVVGTLDDGGAVFVSKDAMQAYSDTGIFDSYKINDNGGDINIGASVVAPQPNPTVTIGTAPDQILLSSKGIDCLNMQQKQTFVGDNWNLGAGAYPDYTDGGGHRCVAEFTMPPSKRVLICLAAKLVVGGSGSIGYASYKLEKSSGSHADDISEGIERNTITFDTNTATTSSIQDLAADNDWVPDALYKVTVMFKMGGNTDTVAVKFAKIAALPQV